jgi:hypothetical protein
MASRHALDGSTVRISSTRAWGDVLHPMPEAANQYQGGPTPPYRLAPSTSTRPVDVFTPFGLLDTSVPFSSLSARTMSSPQHQSSGGMRLSKQIHNVQANKQHPAVASNHTAETMSLGPHRTYHLISISSGLSSDMWHQLSKQPSTRDLTSTTITQLLRNMRELYAPTQSRLPSKAYVHVLLVCVSPLKGRCGLSYV